MKVHFMGAFDGKGASLPNGTPVEGAVAIKEPGDPRKLVMITNITALVLFLVLVAILLLRGGVKALNFRGVLVGALLLFPRDLLRLPCFKGDAYYYTNFHQSMPFLMGPEEMGKTRYLLMTLLPDLVLGLIPFVLFLIWPNLSFLGSMGAMVLPMGAGDYLMAWLILRQMPKDAVTYRHRFHSYWYIPE